MRFLTAKNWFELVNLGVGAVAALFLVLAFFFFLSRPSTIPIVEYTPQKVQSPKRAFSRSTEEYEMIGAPLLKLKFSPITLQLPSLQNILVYYGRNERPDASQEQSKLNFSFTGSDDIASIPPEEPLYLLYDQSQPRVKYIFSPNNQKTSLWIEATGGDEEANVNVAMVNEAGEIIRKPEKNARFTLKEKAYGRFGRQKWEIGKWKVDGTILARQKARWYGQDLFLERHGGEEYQDFIGKQRIDFTSEDNPYSVFVGPENVLAWKDNRWVEMLPGDESRKYPILVINSVDERIMKLGIWNEDGTSKVNINLIKSRPPRFNLDIEKNFKFIGARTRTQLMFEVKGKRMLISPKDWLLYHDGEWKKLKRSQEIDDYVQRKTTGTLFVIDDITRDDGRSALRGTVFDDTRTDAKEIEIILQQGAAPTVTQKDIEQEQMTIEVQDQPEDVESPPRPIDAQKALEERQREIQERGIPQLRGGGLRQLPHR